MRVVSGGLLCALVASISATAAAQQPSPRPGNLPDNPYVRPPDMAPNDKAVDSAHEQIRRGVNEADATRIAKTARAAARARAAKAGDVTAGRAVADKLGVQVGIVTAVEADGVVIRTERGQLKVPIEAFGINRKGLLLDLTKEQFDTLVGEAIGVAAN